MKTEADTSVDVRQLLEPEGHEHHGARPRHRAGRTTSCQESRHNRHRGPRRHRNFVRKKNFSSSQLAGTTADFPPPKEALTLRHFLGKSCPIGTKQMTQLVHTCFRQMQKAFFLRILVVFSLRKYFFRRSIGAAKIATTRHRCLRSSSRKGELRK